MNLDWLTCIQEFGVPLQMINMTWFIKIKPYKIRIRRKKHKLKILDAIFDVSNEIEDIVSDPNDICNDGVIFLYCHISDSNYHLPIDTDTFLFRFIHF
jgi:hypothetical protein